MIENALGRQVPNEHMDISPDGKGLIISTCAVTRSGCAVETVYLTSIDLDHFYKLPNDYWKWSPSGTKAISIGVAASSLYVVEQGKDSVTKIATISSGSGSIRVHSLSEPIFSPDESKVYWAENTRLFEVDLETVTKRELTPKEINYSRILSLALSPDGTQAALLVQKEDYYLYITQPDFDFSNAQPVYMLRQRFNGPSITWFPNGNSILVKYHYCGSGGCGGGDLYADIIDLADGGITPLPRGLQEICGWSPDNTLWFVRNVGYGLTLTYRIEVDANPEKNFLFDGICPKVWLETAK